MSLNFHVHNQTFVVNFCWYKHLATSINPVTIQEDVSYSHYLLNFLQDKNIYTHSLLWCSCCLGFAVVCVTWWVMVSDSVDTWYNRLAGLSITQIAGASMLSQLMVVKKIFPIANAWTTSSMASIQTLQKHSWKSTWEKKILEETGIVPPFQRKLGKSTHNKAMYGSLVVLILDLLANSPDVIR